MALALLCVSCVSIAAGSALQAQATAQTYPIISLDTPLARDAQTFEADKTLVAACQASGATKAQCLCVTHVMKYELTLAEYKAAVRLYGQTDRETVRRALKTEGVSAQEIGTAEQMSRDLMKDQDFPLRCAEAKSYYRTSKR